MNDYREAKYRREVFLDFYKFHLESRGHAGAVYYTFPYIFEKLNMSQDERYWFCFLNGCCQNVLTTYLLFKNFRDFSTLDLPAFSKFFRDHYIRLGWDTDRRYVKNKLEECIISYQNALGGRAQSDYFNSICNTGNEYKNFDLLWDEVLKNFSYFGRLATFSYLEYLRIAGLNLDCSQLFLDDIQGSKSHRNGLCKVLGRDDLDWTKQNEVSYSKSLIEELSKEGEKLLDEARSHTKHPDVSYFTLETTLCCYKGWHRVNRRYPNVYNDMFYERIKKAESIWVKEDFSIFWQAREKYLPQELRLEDNILDKGLCREKQNYYRKTGEVIMMESEGYEVTEKPWTRNCILICGACGAGKTWVMEQLLKGLNTKKFKLKKFLFHESKDLIIIGKYDGTTFQGSDRLSMAVMADIQAMLEYINKSGKVAIFEGDRFTNSKFIEKADPAIIKITDEGSKGREKRGSKQTPRHLKSIATRVRNITPHKEVPDSESCLDYFKSILGKFS